MQGVGGKGLVRAVCPKDTFSMCECEVSQSDGSPWPAGRHDCYHLLVSIVTRDQREHQRCHQCRSWFKVSVGIEGVLRHVSLVATSQSDTSI